MNSLVSRYLLIAGLFFAVVVSGFFAKTTLLDNTSTKGPLTPPSTISNVECFIDGKSVFTSRENCLELSKKGQQIPAPTLVPPQPTKSIEIKPSVTSLPQPTGPKSDQLQYKFKAQDTIRRIDVINDKTSTTKYQAEAFKSSCVSDQCRNGEDAIIKTSQNLIDAGNKSKDWLRQIIDFIDKGGVLDQKSIDSLNKIYDYYN